MTPRVRREALLVQQVEGETLVYDQKAHRAHCLNGSAAEVFRLADGVRTVPELARALGESLGCDATELVRAALAELDRAGLLDEAPEAEAVAVRRSRRAALRRLGLGALLPTVISVLAPTPAEALATCVDSCAGPQPFGTVCSPIGDCSIDSSGLCDGAGNCV